MSHQKIASNGAFTVEKYPLLYLLGYSMDTISYLEAEMSHGKERKIRTALLSVMEFLKLLEKIQVHNYGYNELHNTVLAVF